VDGALANQLRKVVARFHATRPGFGVFVDADLVKFGSIDANRVCRYAGKLDGVSVLDEFASSAKSKLRRRMPGKL